MAVITWRRPVTYLHNDVLQVGILLRDAAFLYLS